MGLKLGIAFILGLVGAAILVGLQVFVLHRTDALWMPALIGFVAGFAGSVMRRLDRTGK